MTVTLFQKDIAFLVLVDIAIDRTLKVEYFSYLISNLNINSKFMFIR